MKSEERATPPAEDEPVALEGREQVAAYYDDGRVVEKYLAKRTGQPLNGLLHRSQVRFVQRLIHARRPLRILEIAPGPARIAAELDFGGCGALIDSSAKMLAAARQRLRASDGRWTLARGDAFDLPVADHRFDLVIALRFIRRFRRHDRLRLYAEARRALAPGGVLVFDAQNRDVSLPHRRGRGPSSYPVYDKLYRLDELIAEVEAAGLRVCRIEAMLRHFEVQSQLNRLRRVGMGGVARALIGAVERIPGSAPSTWMVVSEAAR